MFLSSKTLQVRYSVNFTRARSEDDTEKQKMQIIETAAKQFENDVKHVFGDCF